MDHQTETLVDLLRVEGVNAKGYGTVPKTVMKDDRLTPIAKLIYCYFCSYAGAGNRAFPSRNTIIRDIGINVGTYHKHIKILKECDYIRIDKVREKGKFVHNIYTLVACPDPDDSSCIKKPYMVQPHMVKPHTNNNNNKKKQYKKHQSNQPKEKPDGWIDALAKVKKNIEYESFSDGKSDKMLNSIVELVAETLCSNAKWFKISGAEMDAEIVKERLRQLDYSDIAYVLNAEFPERISNPKQYLLTVLFNAPVVSEMFWNAEVKKVSRKYYEQKFAKE